ncbi:MAG: DUF1365 domain-containing protein [Acidimicrobiales bacterium]
MSDSAIYWGRVTHRRYLPRQHHFDYRVMMFLLYLDELEDIARDVRGVELEGDVTGFVRPARFASRLPGRYVLRRRDFLPEYEGTLEQAARSVYRDLVGAEAPGRVAVLANLASLGWNFNPITLYFFYDDTRVVSTIAEVTNTPWGERHLYVLGPPGTVEFDKAHHVSPFLTMDGRYRLTYAEPSSDFRLAMTLFDPSESIEGPGARRFGATMHFSRAALTSREVARASRRYPDMAFRVSFRIYVQAARLFAKRIKYVPRPTTARGVTNVPTP